MFERARPGSSSLTACRSDSDSDKGSPAVRSDEEPVGQVDEGEIDRAVLARVEASPFHVADDADDRGPWTRRAAAVAEPAAEHLLAGEEPVGPRAVDDDDVLLQGVLVEQPAALEAQADGLEERGETPTHVQIG